VDALAEGAFDLVPKPAAGDGLDGFAESLVRRSGSRSPRAAGSVARPGAWPSRALGATRGGREGGRDRHLDRRAARPRGADPRAPISPLGIGTLIVQHMPPGFTKSLAARFDHASELHVREAAGGEILDPRIALIAPGGRHLRISAEGRTTLSDEPEIGGLRPRADLTIVDAARLYKDRLLLVVMTGMGSDGLEGARRSAASAAAGSSPRQRRPAPCTGCRVP
jgi:two-component system chemotaxis response regulator CheB